MSFVSGFLKKLNVKPGPEVPRNWESFSSGVHQEELSAYFGDLTLPDDVKPPGNLVCMMLFTNRSGSNVLGEYFRASHRFTGFLESINYRRVIKDAKENDLRSFFDYLKWHVTRLGDGNRIIGIKASVDQAALLFQCGAIPNYLDKVRWITVQRDDILAQAISFSIAAQSLRWTSDSDAMARNVVYNYQDIERRVRILCNEQAQIKAFLAMRGIVPIVANYEDFAADPEGYVRSLASQIGVDSLSFDKSLLKLRPQSDGRNEEFRAQFIEDFARQT